MAHPDDYSDDYPPWGKRVRAVPLRTYSGKVVYKRKVHRWTERDLVRIMAKISPPDNADDSWMARLVAALRSATLAMLERLLPYLSEKDVVDLYDWAYNIVETVVIKSGLDDATIRKYLAGLESRLKGL